MPKTTRVVIIDVIEKGVYNVRFSNQIPDDLNCLPHVDTRSISHIQDHNSSHANGFLEYSNDDTMKKILNFLKESSNIIRIHCSTSKTYPINAYAAWMIYYIAWDAEDNMIPRGRAIIVAEDG